MFETFVTFRNLVGSLFFLLTFCGISCEIGSVLCCHFLKALKTNGHAGSFFVTASCIICGNVYKEVEVAMLEGLSCALPKKIVQDRNAIAVTYLVTIAKI